MGLCQHVFRRGGIYWFRRRLAESAKGAQSQWLYLSLKVRDPARARVLGRMVAVEADKLAGSNGQAILTAHQQKAILARFIDEQISEVDWAAIAATRKPAYSYYGQEVDAVSEHRGTERVISAVYGIVAVAGPTKTLTHAHKAQLEADGFTPDEILEIAYHLFEFGPAYDAFGPAFNDKSRSTIGPPYEYFVAQLDALGVPVTDGAIEYARRLWFRAQAQVLADTDRRYGRTRSDFANVYRDVVEQRGKDPAPVVPKALAPVMPEAPPPEAPPPEAPQAAPAPPSSSPRAPAVGAASILALVETMLNAKKKAGEWRPKTIAQHRSLAAFFVKILGSDDPCAITQASLCGYRRSRPCIPI